jgi:flagellar hook-associated protein 1 FlgK
VGSAWFGLSTALRGLVASQVMLDIAAHNTANANTPGFSRQRVGLIASAPFSYPAFNRSGLPGQVGTGVSVATITRVRDAFLDLQLRGQIPLEGAWTTRRDELTKVEAVFPEPDASGLGTVLGRLWDAWHELAADPTSAAARSAVVESAATLTSRLNHDAAQLETLASGIDYQVGQDVAKVNDLAARIASLNTQIQRVRITGDHPNDLEDQRDTLLDELVAIVPATLQPEADGTVTVLVGGTDLVSRDRTRTLSTVQDLAGHAIPAWADGSTVVVGSARLGTLASLRDVDLAGYRTRLDTLAAGVADAVNALHRTGIDPTTGLPSVLDLFTYTPGRAAASIAVNGAITANPGRLVTAAAANQPGDGSIAGAIADLRLRRFSAVGGASASDLVQGDTLATGTSASITALSVAGARPQTYTFTSTAPGTITITGADLSTQTISVAAMTAGSSQILDFSQLGISINLQSTGAKSAADIVTDLTAAENDTLVVTTSAETAAAFYAGLIGKIGSDTRQAIEMARNQALVTDHLRQRRESTSGVSLDEEAADMIRFQHAYQAAARVITVIDEMLDTLINRTGVVGR